MKLGVISDTHGYFDPRLPEMLAGVDAILHAGDVGSDEVLDKLGEIAPVHAVRGNTDHPGLKLRPSLHKKFEGVQVMLAHRLPVPQAELEAWADGEMLGKLHPERRDAFLQAFSPSTRVVIFGHSHQPCLVKLGHKLFFNPGSAGPQRFSLPRCFGLLEIFPRGVRGTMMSLERQTDRLPAKVWFPITEQ
jgi:hypothetical protein